MNHIMLDIETLGTTPGSAIVTLGAVLFDINAKDNPEQDARVLSTDRVFYRKIDQQSNNLLGLHVESDTLDWWNKQEAAAKFEAFYSKHRQALTQVLIEFAAWYVNSKALCLWSHGATFDIVLVEEVYRRLGLDTPWTYKHHRDTRTLFDIANVKYGSTKHYALQDAYEQACAVQEAYSKIKGHEDYLFLLEMRERLENKNIEFVLTMIDDWIHQLEKNT